MRRFTLFLMFLATQGCSGGGNNTDGGLPDGTDGDDGDGYVGSQLGIDPYDNEKRQVYDSCDYGHYTLYIITAEAESGDRVVFHKRMYSPDFRGGSMPANLESAQATVNGTTRSADDYFSLVYSADHHNKSPLVSYSEVKQ